MRRRMPPARRRARASHRSLSVERLETRQMLAAAVFVGTDRATQGSWQSAYGADGYDLPGVAASIPSYATVSVAASVGGWVPGPDEPRALTDPRPGATARVAPQWYGTNAGLTLDVHLTDGSPHEVALYALDWTSDDRSEQVDVIDDATGAVLDTETVAHFAFGAYLAWQVTGDVTFRVSDPTGSAAETASGLFFGGAVPGAPPVPPLVPGSVAYVGTDRATQGSWQSAYGADGYDLPGVAESLPSYATASVAAGVGGWVPGPDEPRALTDPRPGATARVAPQWCSVTGSSSFPMDIHVHVTDGSAHEVALYALDWNSDDRSERVDVIDDATGEVIDSRSVTGFAFGAYLAWQVTGDVTFRVTATSGVAAETVSGLFFGGAVPGAPPVPPLVPGSVAYVGTDRATQGSWQSAYGADGYDLPGVAESLPSYATASVAAGVGGWVPGPDEPRALTDPRPGATARVAPQWYSGMGSSSFPIDIHVHVGDGPPRVVAMYALDWGDIGRSERVDVTDDATGAVLDTETVSGFTAGAYLVWDVSGDVTFRVTSTDGSADEVLSGLFFGGPAAPPTPPPAPGGLTATGGDHEIDLAWTDVAGEAGFAVERSPDGVSGWAPVGTAGAGVTAFADTGLGAGFTAYYRVRASNAAGYSGYSPVAGATTAPAADAEGDSLTAALDVPLAAGTPYAHQAVIGDGLSPDRDVDLYEVRLAAGQYLAVQAEARNPDEGGPLSGLDAYLRVFDGSGGELAADDNAVSPSDGIWSTDAALGFTAPEAGTYYVGVSSRAGRAYDPAAAGSAGAAADDAGTGAYLLRMLLTDVPPPAAPSLTATAGAGGVGLSWTDVANESGFTVERYPGGPGGWAVIATVGAGVTSYLDTGAAPGTAYSYRVRATNAAGSSPYAPASGTTSVPRSTSYAPLVVSPPGFTEGVASTARVASFDPGDPSSGAGDYQASVDWGDGTTSAGAVVADDTGAGGYWVVGTHAFPRGGAYPVTVTLTGPGVGTSRASGTADVAEHPVAIFHDLTPTRFNTSPLNADIVTWSLSFNGLISGFTEGHGDPASDFSATIDWGDGTTSAGTIQPPATPFDHFGVTGSHTYGDVGVYSYKVTVNDVDGDSAVDTGTAVINGPPGDMTYQFAGATPSGGRVYAVFEGVPGSQPSDYTVTEQALGVSSPVTYPGGTPSGGLIRYLGSGMFALVGAVGSMPYTLDSSIGGVDASPYTLDLTIKGPSNFQYSFSYDNQSYERSITDYSVDSVSLTLDSGSGQVAEFLDPTSSARLYYAGSLAIGGIKSATIDWGDGTPAEGAELSQPAPPYPFYDLMNSKLPSVELCGYHTYAPSMQGHTVTVTVHVEKDDGTDFDRKSTFHINHSGNYVIPYYPNPYLTPLNNILSLDISCVAGVASGPVELGEIDFNGADASLTDKAGVTVTWGDGSPASAGKMVRVDDDHYKVYGSHLYGSPGAYTVTVRYGDGSSTATATVITGALTGQALADDPTQGQTLPVGLEIVGLNTGRLSLQYPLDFDQSPGTSAGGVPDLTYNSNTIDPLPVIEAELSTDPTRPAPSSIQYQLTFGPNDPQPWVTVNTPGHSPGDTYTILAAVKSPVLRTDIYGWVLRVRESFGGGVPVDSEISGVIPVVVRDGSDPNAPNPYGPGWGISGIGRLDVFPGYGAFRDDGSGGGNYWSKPSGLYTQYESKGDFGILTFAGAGNAVYKTPVGWEWSYDQSGRLTSLADPYHQAIEYKYDPSGYLTEVDSPDGGVTRFVYSQGVLVNIVEPGDRVVTLVHDSGTGDLVGIMAPDGSSRTFTYDANHRLVTDRWGPRATTITYDPASGVVRAVSSAPGLVTQIQPAALGITSPGQAVVSDELSRLTTYTLDSGGRVLRLDRPASASQVWERDDQGLVIRYTDESNSVTTFVYDESHSGSGALIESDLPNGAVERFRNLTAGRPVQVLGPMGALTSYSYYGGDRPSSETDPDGNSTTLTYDSTGLLLTSSSATRVTNYSYDSDRRLSSVTDPDGGTTAYTYDYAGNPRTVTDPDGRVTTTVYDAMNRLVERVEPPPTPGASPLVTTMAYDPAGELVSETDPDGIVTEWAYDRRGLVTGETVAAGTADAETTTRVYDAAGELVSLIDARGKETDYGYDDEGRQTWVKDPDGLVTTTVYDPDGDPVETIDPRGVVTDRVFDAMGRVTSVTVADGTPDAETTRYTYDLAGEVVSVIDAREIETDYAYDPDGNLIRETDGVGSAHPEPSRDVYDIEGNLIATFDALGNETDYGYDAEGRRTSVTEAAHTPLARTTRTVYDPAGNVVAAYDAAGTETTYAYDGDGREVAVTEGANTATPRTTRTAYDPDGNVLSTVDARGTETDYTYDAEGRRTSVTEGANTATPRVTRTVYDADGDVTAVYDAAGTETTFAYDDAGREIGVTEGANTPAPRSTLTFYDPDGNVASTVDARGTETDYTYDREGRQKSITEGANTLHPRTSFTRYDPDGNVVAETDAAGVETDYGYDEEGRRVTAKEAANTPLARTTTTVYDAVGNVTATVDPLGHETDYAYDALNRRVAVKDPLQHLTTTAYDPDDDVLSVTDPDGNTTAYAYDAFGNVLSMTDPLNHTATYSYDPGDNLTSATDRDGRRRDMTYDPFGDLVLEQWFDAQGGPGDTTAETYDADGNLLTASDHDGGTVVSFAYDAFGRVTARRGPFGETLAYGYDPGDDPTSVTDSYGGVVSSTYDPFGGLVGRSWSDGSSAAPLVVDIGYTPTGEVASVSRYLAPGPGSTSARVDTAYGYDPAERLTSVDHTAAGSGAALSRSYAVTLDDAGRATSQTDDGTTKTFTYDDTDQLLTDGGTTFSYDANGNRTGPGYQPGTGNQLLSDGTWSYTYDGEGNRVKKVNNQTGETWTYGYDLANRMVWAEDRSGDGGPLVERVDDSYDALGDRIEEDVTTPGRGTAVQRFAYDGGAVWADLDGNNNVSRRYLLGDAVDQVLGQAGPDGAPAWYLTDRLGSVRDVVDAAGAVADHIDYDGSGRTAAESDPSAAPAYGFQGLRADPWVHVYHAMNRDLDVAAGVWTTQDPTGLAADVNPYRFVGNQPTGATDPTGLEGSPLAEVGKAFKNVAELTAVVTIPGGSLALLLDPALRGRTLQTALEAANGVTDIPFDLANLFHQAVQYARDNRPTVLPLAKAYLTNEEVERLATVPEPLIDPASYDWSRDAVVSRGGGEHRATKLIGGLLITEGAAGALRAGQAVGEASLGPNAVRSLLRGEGTGPLAQNSAARFRGEPFAFGNGSRESRVAALLDEASQASGTRLSDLVDEVRYVQGSSYFDVEGSSRVLAIGSDAFGKTRVGQLIEGAHEIGHAQVFNKLVRQNGFGPAVNDYFGAGRSFGTSLYAREEVLVERLARARVRRYLGGLTPQQEAASTRYIEGWRPVWLGP